MAIQLKKFEPDKLFGPKKTIMDPADVLRTVGVHQGSVVADFGSGVGFFAMPAAIMVGNEGKIWAVDVNENFLESLSKKTEESGFNNIQTVLADLEKLGSTKISDASCDLVLIFNVMHQASGKKEIMEEAKRIIKLGGRLVIIDWNKEESPLGPDQAIRVAPEILKEIAASLGFKFEKNFDTDIYHYGLEFIK